MQQTTITGWQDVLPFAVSQIERIPAALWVGVLTFAGTLLVVWRTNAHHVRRLRVQLEAEDARHEARLRHELDVHRMELDASWRRTTAQFAHDAEERSRERLISMRREVYFQEFPTLHAFTQEIPRAWSTKTSSDLLSKAVASVSRIVLICEPKTRDLAVATLKAFHEAALQTAESTMPVSTATLQCEQAEETYKQLLSERGELFERQRAALDLPVVAPDQIVKLRSANEVLEACRTRIREAHQERIKALEELGQARKEALRSVASAAEKAATSLGELQRGLRSELGIADQIPGLEAGAASEDAGPGSRYEP